MDPASYRFFVTRLGNSTCKQQPDAISISTELSAFCTYSQLGYVHAILGLERHLVGCLGLP